MILITGANGQLGKEFQKFLSEKNREVLALDIQELDITDLEKTRKILKNIQAEYIINCAAYNDVDKAQEEWKKAFSVNAIGVRNLAIVAAETGAELVHFSSDYVFSGNRNVPYTIYDRPNPINKYGESKVLGERFLKELNNKYYLVRTSWLFGDGEKNFLRKVLLWASSRQKIRVVDDEVSSPTCTSDLAKAVWDIIKIKAYGTYHITNSSCSRYEWAELILKEINWQGVLERSKRQEFNLPAKRPDYTVLDNFGFKETTGYEMPSWQEAT
nr:dTDP-4-dehydrorhamnose reductase [Petrotogaceae bacterium]